MTKRAVFDGRMCKSNFILEFHQQMAHTQKQDLVFFRIEFCTFKISQQPHY
jgi:hypothetical protein